jgi:hypothetical protein
MKQFINFANNIRHIVLVAFLVILNSTDFNLQAQTFDVDFFHTFDKSAGVEQSHVARHSTNGNLAFAHFYRGQPKVKN